MNARALLIWPLCGLAALTLAPPASGQGRATLLAVARFHFDAGAPLVAPAGVALDGSLCVGTVDGYIHALGPDGSYRWSYSVHGAVTRRPLFVGNRWYVATSAERLYAFTREGALAWVFKPPSAVNSELAADASGRLLFVAADRFLYGVSARGAVTLRTPFSSSLPENQLAFATPPAGTGEPQLEFPSRELRDPEGHEWRGRSDGVVELRAQAGAVPSLLRLTHSPLFAPIWSAASRYAVLSARSGVVFALAAVDVRAGH